METGTINGLNRQELDLAATLNSGQMFRWTRDSDGAYRGVVGLRRLRLSQSEDYSTIYYEADKPDAQNAVRRFLRLDDLNLAETAEVWSDADLLFAESWERQPGVRLLRQNPEECFFSFLCASVAPIRRISGMLTATAAECGVCFGDGWTAFPTAEMLADVSEKRLRELGLGFRARRIAEAARTMLTMPEGWLESLRVMPHEEARALLCKTFFGMGWKIADCVCLFSLDKDNAIPVDVHIWRIAQTRYATELSGRSLTPANYNRVTAAFREKFGDKAGWAQQILFYRAAVGSRRKTGTK